MKQQQQIRSGEKVERSTTTSNPRKVELGDSAPAFVRTTVAGKKLAKPATRDAGKVRLGDSAPAFTRTIRAGDKVAPASATRDPSKVRLGDSAPVFGR
jgi:hypothetical protein